MIQKKMWLADTTSFLTAKRQGGRDRERGTRIKRKNKKAAFYYTTRVKNKRRKEN